MVGLVVVVVLLIVTDWLPRRASRYLNTVLEGAAGVHLEIGDFGGNILSDLAAENVVVTRSGTPSETLAVFPRIEAAYDARDLWRRRWIVRSVVIDSPVLFVPGDSLREFIASFSPPDTGRVSRKGAVSLFDFHLEALHLRGGQILRREDSTRLVDSLDILVAAHSEGETITARLHRAEGVLPDFGRVSASGRIETSPGRLRVDSAEIKTARSRLEASGTPSEWAVRSTPLDLADAEFLIGTVEGTLDFDGTVAPESPTSAWTVRGIVSGNLEGFPLEEVFVRLRVEGGDIRIDSLTGRVAGALWRGSGTLDVTTSPERYTFTGSVRHFDLERWAHDTFPTDLNGLVTLRGEGLTESALSLDLDLDLGPGRFDDFAIDSAIGRIAVSLEEVIFDDDFLLFTAATEINGGGRIGFDDSLDLFVNVYSHDLRQWDSRVFIDSLAGRAYAYLYLTGSTADPDLAGRITSDSLRLYNLRSSAVEGWFYAPGFLSRPSGTVNFRFGPSDAWGWDLDSLVVRAELRNRLIMLDSMAVFSPILGVQGRGGLDWSSDTVPVHLYPLTAQWEGQDFRAADTIAFAVDPEGFHFHRLAVESDLGVLRAAGRVNYNQSADVDFSVDGLQIVTLAHHLLPDIKADGRLRAEGTIRGFFDAPILTLEGAIENLTYDYIPLGDLSGSVEYREERLRSEELRLRHPSYEVVAAGLFPVAITLGGDGAQIRDAPLSGRLSATGEALDLAARLLPETIESVEGPFSILAALGGTPKAPHVTGSAHLRSGKVKAIEIANPIENLQVDLELRQDTILVRRAEGTIRQGKRRGTVSASGQIQILSYDLYDYDLTVTGRRVPARFEFEDFFAETDFDLTVTGASPPLVGGRIAPRRVEDRTPFASEDQIAIVDTTGWNWDFTVVIPGNFWIHNEQIDAELAADMRILRERGRLTYLGDAQVIRGRVYLFDKVGRIRQGTLTFDNVNQPDPRLDIEVAFRIRQPRPDQARAGEGSQVIDLDLHVGGRASEPLIQPEPPYTEQDVLLLLTANTNFGGGEATYGSDPWANRLKFAATGLFFSEVQRAAARKLGLETLEISSEGDPTDAQITVGRYVSPHLYLYGTSPVDVGGGQEVGFEYRFNRHVFLEGNRDRANLYRLNLHFTWDY